MGTIFKENIGLCHLVFVIPVLRLHVDLDQLGNEVIAQFMPVANIRIISSYFSCCGGSTLFINPQSMTPNLHIIGYDISAPPTASKMKISPSNLAHTPQTSTLYGRATRVPLVDIKIPSILVAICAQ